MTHTKALIELTIDELEDLMLATSLSTKYIDLLNQLSLELLKKNRTDPRALTTITQSYNLCTKHFPNYHTGLINALITMSEYHRFQHNYAEVMRLHTEAEVICLTLDDQTDLTDLIRLRSSQSVLAYMMANWTYYININVELIQLAQKADQPIMEATGYHALAVAQGNLNNHKEEIRYQEKAVAIAKTLPDKTKYAFYLLGLSAPYSRLKQYDKAIDYAQSAYDLFRGQNNDYEARTLQTLGELYSEMGDYEQARHYFQRELDLINAINFDFFRPSIYCGLGMVYQQMDDSKAALHWLESGIELAEGNNRTPILLANYQYLIQAYKDNQEFEKALTIMEKLDALKTEVHDTKLDNQRQVLLIMHETEDARIDARIANERADNLAKQAEKDREYFQELAKLQRETLHAVTHDLKNPLTSILLKAAKLQRLIPDEFHVHLKSIENQVMTMNNLIMDMLEIAKLETKRALNFEKNSMSSLVAIVIEQNRSQAEEKDITFYFEQTEKHDEFTFQFDSKYMHRALSNLVSNAIKYSPTQTQVTIEFLRSNDELVIRISDNGYGIPAEHMPYIFERFYRAHDYEHQHIKGTGLGLSIVKSIIEQHNGRIDVKSTVGVGSTFSIYLPIKQTNPLKQAAVASV